MNDSPDTKNHSSMTEKNIDQPLWNRYSIESDNDRTFLDAKILNEIAGKELATKNRTVKRSVSEMVVETILDLDDLVRKIIIPQQRSHSIAVAAGIMQMIILRGFKEIPWNKKRRNLVKFLFSETMLPKYSPFSVINHQNRSTPPLEVRKFIKNPDINRIINLNTLSSSITLRIIKKFSNHILIQAPSYSIFEA